MEKYYYDGERYYYKDGKWLDSMFTNVPLVMVNRLNQEFVKKNKLEDKSMSELLNLIDSARMSGNYLLAALVLEAALCKADVSDIKWMLARLTSNYRKIGRPEKAITIANSYLHQYGESLRSAALFTSLAAACCDLGNYSDARKYADMSCELSGNQVNDMLTSVYSRIDRESA